MLAYLRPAQIAWRLWRRLQHPWFALSPPPSLATAAATLPDPTPPDLWPGDAAHGRRIHAGTIRLLTLDHPLPAAGVDWHPADRSPLWRFTLHYFDWLRDLEAAAAAAGPAAAQPFADRARALVADWIRAHETWHPLAWHAYPTALRLFAWLRHAPFLTRSADPAFTRVFVRLLDAHVRHLARVPEYDVGGNHLIKTLKALAAAAVCLPAHGPRLEPALSGLAEQLGRQILPDGCHDERSPAYHLQVLCDLLDLDALLVSPPEWLRRAIAAMAGPLFLLRHGDGGLPLFNDGDVGDPALLAAVETRVAGRATGDPRRLGQGSAALPFAGYYRLAAGGCVVLADAGRCAPDDLPAHAHADALSFEMSVGAERVVVNCGTYAYQDPVWRPRLRGTSAHSTLTVDDRDSAEVFGVFRLGRRPRVVRARPVGDEVDTALALDLSHDGYRSLGLIHHRRLQLSADGRRLDGRDTVVGPGAGRRLAVRFHLHPDVAVGAVADGRAIDLTLSGGDRIRFAVDPIAPAGDAGPGLSVAEPALSVAESVYAPHFYTLQPTRCLVVRAIGDGDEDSVIVWSFERI